MIYKALHLIASQLNDYLKLSFSLKEDIVFLSPIKDNDKFFPSNRVSISLTGLERETSGGISFQRVSVADKSKLTAPSWQINVQVLVAVIFQDKQYEEALQILSGILRFIQKNNIVVSQNNDFSFSIDVINLTIQELANLWGICGDSYFPSVMCRLRLITIDEQQIINLSSTTTTSEINAGIKK